MFNNVGQIVYQKNIKNDDEIFEIAIDVGANDVSSDEINHEIITSVKDKDNKLVEGDPDVIKTANDIWKFSKNMWSQDPTWYLVDTSSK